MVVMPLRSAGNANTVPILWICDKCNRADKRIARVVGETEISCCVCQHTERTKVF